MSRIMVGVLAVAALAACGGSTNSEQAAGTYSCNFAADKECLDISTPAGSSFSSTDVATIRAMCVQPVGGGTWATTACLTAGRFATCTFTVPTSTSHLSVPMITQQRFYTGFVDEVSVCMSNSGVLTRP